MSNNILSRNKDYHACYSETSTYMEIMASDFNYRFDLPELRMRESSDLLGNQI